MPIDPSQVEVGKRFLEEDPEDPNNPNNPKVIVEVVEIDTLKLPPRVRSRLVNCKGNGLWHDMDFFCQTHSLE